MQYLIGIAVAILGYLAFKKNTSTSVLSDNDKTNAKVNELDTSIANGNTNIATQTQKETDLKKEIKNADSQTSSSDADISDFLNKR